MTDLVSQLVGALEGLDEAYCRAGSPLTREERAEDRKRLIAARAALTAAKAGGWVAVPVEPTPEMLKAGHGSISCVGSCGEASPPEVFDFYDVWDAMLSARPTTPPKEQA